MAVELLARSNGSFLRGASHPEELVDAAVALGLSHLAIVDLDGVYGLPKAWARARRHGGGCQLIAGAELTLLRGAGRGGLALLARDKAGWSLLCRLLTASHAGRPKGEAGLDWEAFCDLVAVHPGRHGLLALPRGAGLGEAFFEEDAAAVYGALKRLFGGGLRIPVARFLDGHDAARTASARALAAAHTAPAVAVNDVHYHQAARRPLQDVLACVRQRCGLRSAGWRLFGNAERHLKDGAAMRGLFHDWPEAVAAADAAAQLCRFDLGELRYRYPGEWIPAGETSQSYLEKLCWEGCGERYARGLPDAVAEQLRHELALVERLGFADYFLTIQELVRFARSRGILCQGRGSAANSALCYVLGITAVDPVKSGLLFERFLSAERAEPPDIDVDFEHERREEVIQHLYERYGRDRAAMAAALITFRSRSAKRELQKVLPAEGREALQGPLMEQLRGFPRHLSIHSGGFVLSHEPLTDLVPIEPARKAGRTVIQWDKYDLDHLGMMKVDVLALGMLSALKRGLDLLGLKDLAAIPPDDPATYAMIQAADTLGVFQIESRAQMNMLGRLRPEGFYDLVIQVAIVRPGPIVGQMVHPYLRRRKGEEPVSYEHPALERILGRTLGVPLFQEQVMRIAMELGGFSPGESDELRRAISAWRADGRLDGLVGRLRQGLRLAGLSEGFCERLFSEIKGFAEYGFPESHAASFAGLVYASSWMKCRHPAEFACALLNAQPLGFYAAHSLVDDAKRHGVEVLAFDPSSAGVDCRLREGRLELGWRMVGGLGTARAEALVLARAAQPFTGLDDLVQRSGLPAAVLQRLALANAFERWGWEPRAALWRLLALRTWQAASPPGQLALGLLPGPGRVPALRELDPLQAVQAQYEAYGLSSLDHPMATLRRRLARPCPPLAEVRAGGRHGDKIRAQGLLIVRQHPGTAKGVVFVTLEDESGLLDLVLWPKVWERLRARLEGEAFLEVHGELQRDRDSVSVLVSDLRGLRLPGLGALDLAVSSHDWH